MKNIAYMAVILSGTALADEVRVIDLKSGEFSLQSVSEYSYTWHQCALQEGNWITMPNLTEDLSVIREDLVRLRQTTVMPNGMLQLSTQYYDRVTFAPLKLEVDVGAPGQDRVYQARYTLDASGFKGSVKRSDGETAISGVITSQMLNGTTMGLPLAMIGDWNLPTFFKASMMSFEGSYEVTAEKVGTKLIKISDEEVEVLQIDVHWKHLESGDIYAPGPNETGGQYWVLSNASDHLPHVIRYKTDSYAIEFTPLTCSTEVSSD